MTAQTWKNFERRVARFFGGERMPLSGMAAQLEKQDIVSPYFFVECKYRTKNSLFEFWQKTGDFLLFDDLFVIHSDNFFSFEKPQGKSRKFRYWKRLFEETKLKAKEIGKIPIVASSQYKKRGFLLIIEKSDFMEIKDILTIVVRIPFDRFKTDVSASENDIEFLKSLQSPQLLKEASTAALVLLNEPVEKTQITDYILTHFQETINQLEELFLSGKISRKAFDVIFNIFKDASDGKVFSTIFNY